MVYDMYHNFEAWSLTDIKSSPKKQNMYSHLICSNFKFILLSKFASLAYRMILIPLLDTWNNYRFFLMRAIKLIIFTKIVSHGFHFEKFHFFLVEPCNFKKRFIFSSGTFRIIYISHLNSILTTLGWR